MNFNIEICDTQLQRQGKDYRSCKPKNHDIAKGIERHSIMVYGLMGAGKSKILNDIFGTSFESSDSFKTVTQDFLCETKYGFNIMDSPGFGNSLTRDMQLRFIEAEGIVETKARIVILAIPMGQDRLQDNLRSVFKAFLATIGRHNWNKIVLAFTRWDHLSPKAWKTGLRYKHNILDFFSEECGSLPDSFNFQCELEPEDSTSLLRFLISKAEIGLEKTIYETQKCCGSTRQDTDLGVETIRYLKQCKEVVDASVFLEAALNEINWPEIIKKFQNFLWGLFMAILKTLCFIATFGLSSYFF
jgi:GTP-binding protein EngB required for normal cell division